MTGQLQLTDEHVAVMRKTIEHVLAHPEEWDQAHWASASATAPCGTAYCFAGHAAVTVAGAQPTGRGNGIVTLNGEPQHVADAARAALGLDTSQTEELFRATNSARRLAELCYLYSGGRVDVLHALPEPTPSDLAREGTQRDDAHSKFYYIRNYAVEHRVDRVTAARRFVRATS